MKLDTVIDIVWLTVPGENSQTFQFDAQLYDAIVKATQRQLRLLHVYVTRYEDIPLKGKYVLVARGAPAQAYVQSLGIEAVCPSTREDAVAQVALAVRQRFDVVTA